MTLANGLPCAHRHRLHREAQVREQFQPSVEPAAVLRRQAVPAGEDDGLIHHLASPEAQTGTGVADARQEQAPRGSERRMRRSRSSWRPKST